MSNNETKVSLLHSLRAQLIIGAVALIGLTIASLGLVVVLLSFLAMNNRKQVVSYLVDRNAGLKNLISSGLEVQGVDDPVAAAVGGPAMRPAGVRVGIECVHDKRFRSLARACNDRALRRPS